MNLALIKYLTLITTSAHHKHQHAKKGGLKRFHKLFELFLSETSIVYARKGSINYLIMLQNGGDKTNERPTP
jgi:hypothetical protein